MRNIFKYHIDMCCQQIEPVIHIPHEITKVLDVQIQDGSPVLWAIVDDEAKDKDLLSTPGSPLNVYFFGTGTSDVEHNRHKDLEYISTTTYHGLVLHWFYEKQNIASPNKQDISEITDIQQARAIISSVGDTYQILVVSYLRSTFYDRSSDESENKAQNIISDMEEEYSLKIANQLYNERYEYLPDYLKENWNKNNNE
jgi:hypothetical protein